MCFFKRINQTSSSRDNHQGMEILKIPPQPTLSGHVKQKFIPLGTNWYSGFLLFPSVTV